MGRSVTSSSDRLGVDAVILAATGFTDRSGVALGTCRSGGSTGVATSSVDGREG